MPSRILIVDDEPDLVDIITERLTEGGYSITSAGSGARAAHLFKSEHYDLVLTDLRMPEGDGVYLIKEIRRMSRETPILLMTANAHDVRDEALMAGAQDVLSKPDDLLSLEDMIAQYLNPETT